MKVGTGLRFSRGGRSALGLFTEGPFAGRKDMRNDASMALYVEVSESMEVVLEWVAKSYESRLSSAVWKDTDDCTIGDLSSRKARQFSAIMRPRVTLPGRQLLFT